jgi:hypothetical protein
MQMEPIILVKYLCYFHIDIHIVINKFIILHYAILFEHLKNVVGKSSTKKSIFDSFDFNLKFFYTHIRETFTIVFGREICTKRAYGIIQSLDVVHNVTIFSRKGCIIKHSTSLILQILLMQQRY